MDARTGQCTTEKHAYSGSLAPLSEEVRSCNMDEMIKADKETGKLSIHFRGPIRLKQLAVYYPQANSVAKRSPAVDSVHNHHHSHRHGHQHLHHMKRIHPLANHVAVERAVGDMVTATIDGQQVEWVNQYAGSELRFSTTASQLASGAASACPSCPVQTAISLIIGTSSTSSSTIRASSATDSATSMDLLPASGSSNGNHGIWSRQAYYNAEAGNSDGFTFLNHFGGTQGKPGTADGGPA